MERMLGDYELEQEFKRLIADRFDAVDLVDFLCIPVEDIIETYEEKIIEYLPEIKEYIYGKEEEDNYGN